MRKPLKGDKMGIGQICLTLLAAIRRESAVSICGTFSPFNKIICNKRKERLYVTNLLRKYFPMLRTRTQLLDEIHSNKELKKIFDSWEGKSRKNS